MALPRLFRPFHSAHGQYSHDLVNLWYKSELGAQILEQEKSVLDQLLPELFGYHLMQMGVFDSTSLASNSPIKHQFFLSEVGVDLLQKHSDDPAETLRSQMSSVKSKCTELPIASDSIDVAVLHHSLDFHDNPHGILREVARTLMPGGKIVIVGFNPWSWWQFYFTRWQYICFYRYFYCIGGQHRFNHFRWNYKLNLKPAIYYLGCKHSTCFNFWCHNVICQSRRYYGGYIVY